MTATPSIGAYRIDAFDVRTASDDELRPLAELQLVLRAEAQPGDPLPPLDNVLRRMRAIPDIARPSSFVARAMDGGVFGQATIWRYEIPENRNLREVDIAVHPEHRRRGIGRALFARIVAAAGEGAELLDAWVNDRVPGGTVFATRVGAKAGLANRVSQTDLATIDRSLVRRWASIDPAGYRLERIAAAFTPERLVPNVIVAYDTMNTAPRGELQHEDWKVTPEQLRDWERTGEKRGSLRSLVLAIHEATGETAGFTEMRYDPEVPTIVQQNGTAVVPAHRGRGIGKWLKARNIEYVFANWPEARIVRTGNAYSNAPMLSINDRLGFKIVWSATIWQLALADARRYSEAAGEEAGRSRHRGAVL